MNIQLQIASILETAKQQIQERMDSQNINASGRTSDALEVEIYDGGVRLKIAGEKIAPFQTLEIGREGGSVPKNFPSIIEQWMLDKGIMPELKPYKRQPSENWSPKYTVEIRSLKIAAGAIANSIAESGTERHRNNRNDIYSPAIDEAVKEISTVLLATISQSIKTASKR